MRTRSPEVTVSFTNLGSPDEKLDIVPDGSGTSPEGLRHTVWISRRYDARFDQSSNGASSAITRRPRSLKTNPSKPKATTRLGAQKLIGGLVEAVSEADVDADAVEGPGVAAGTISAAAAPSARTRAADLFSRQPSWHKFTMVLLTGGRGAGTGSSCK